MAGREPTSAIGLSKVKQMVITLMCTLPACVVADQEESEEWGTYLWQHFPQPGLLILGAWFV